MKIKIVERVKGELRHQWELLQCLVVNRAFPLLKGWMLKNDPWTSPEGTRSQRLAEYLWDHVGDYNKVELGLTQMFLRPVEWDTSKQVDIEARIHGLPIVDPEQPFTTEPAREVVNPDGRHFVVVMKRAPAPVIPKPGRSARKRKTA